MISRLATISLATLWLAGGAAAQAPTTVGSYADWTAYSVSTGSGKVCYALAQPKNRKPEGLNRDPAYFFVSTRPGEKVRNEISVIMGFPLKPGSDVGITVNGTPFIAYVKEDGAWIRDSAEEQRLVDALRKGKDLVVKGVSGRGNVTTDSYSLSGISGALDKVAQECR